MKKEIKDYKKEGLMDIELAKHFLDDYPNDFSEEKKEGMMNALKKCNELKLKGEIDF